MELMTEEWHNKFGVFKNGFGQFEYILPEKRSFRIKVIFSFDYIWLRQTSSERIMEDDILSIWNKDLVKRDISVEEWKALYHILTGEELIEKQ